MMKEIKCNAENCKEEATFFLGVDVEIKSKKMACCEKTHLQTPLCRTHAILFSVANEHTDYGWKIADMKQGLG